MTNMDTHEITLVHNSVAYHLSTLEIVTDISVGQIWVEIGHNYTIFLHTVESLI